MSYLSKLFSHWFKHRLTEGLYWIPLGAIFAILVLFFGNVIFNMDITYLFAWKWSWIVGNCLSMLYSFLWLWARYSADHELAKLWETAPEKVFLAATKYKVFHKQKMEDIRKWDKNEFVMKYNIASMVHNVVKDL